MAPSLEQLAQCSEGSQGQGQAWIRHSLMNHKLSAQLQVLVGNRQHLLQHYSGMNYTNTPYVIWYLVGIYHYCRSCGPLCVILRGSWWIHVDSHRSTWKWGLSTSIPYICHCKYSVLHHRWHADLRASSASHENRCGFGTILLNP